MLAYLANLFSTFILGLLTPLTAVCVLPLYPGFLAFLSRKSVGDPGEGDTSVDPAKDPSRGPLLLGLLVTSGVISFMLLLGLIFTTILEVSLTRIVDVASPIAFGILAVVSLFLILNVEARLPQLRVPRVKNSLLNAFLFGFFFGAIAAPCNPGMIAAFFTKAFAASTLDYFSNLLHFILFGLGMGFPLIVFSALSTMRSQGIIRFLVRHRTIINRAAGILMLGISLYYLIFVFRILG